MDSSSSLRSTITSLSKNTSLFLVTRITGACVSIGLLPLFTRYLTTSEYGIIAILDSTVEIFGAFFAIGLGRAVVRFFHGAADDQQRKRVVSTGIAISGTITVVALVALTIFYRSVSIFAFKSHEYDNFVLLAVSTLLIGLPGGMVSAALMASARTRFICTIELIRIVFGALLRIVLVVLLEQGVSGVLWTNFICAVIFNVGLVVWMISSVGLGVNRSLIRPMIRYGIPFAPTLLCGIAMHSLNRFYLQAYGTSDQVGYFQTAYQLPFMLYSIISNSFDGIWSSHTIFNIAQAPDALNQYSRISTYFLSFLSFILFVVAISANVLVKIFFAPSYAPASPYIPIIAFGLWLHAFHLFVRTGVYLSKDTYLLAINHALTLGATVLFNWLLIPRFGIYGAAFASIIIYFFFSFTGGIIYKGFVYLDLRRLAAVSIVWISLVLIRNRIGTDSIYMEILYIILFSAVYLGFMFYLPFCMSKEERSDIFIFIKNALSQKGNILKMFKS